MIVNEAIKMLETMRERGDGNNHVGLFGFNGGRVDKRKIELLKHYAGKDSREFIQWDGFNVGRDGEDCVMHPDDDGHCIFGQTFRWELMVGSDARVLIPVGADPAVTVALLKKIIKWIERDGLMTHEQQQRLNELIP
jgi:hypothetical protein